MDRGSLRGRFDAIFKAADTNQLLLAIQRLKESQQQLATLIITPLDAPAADEFGKLIRDKKLRKLGRGDLLIASIVLANKATLVTRNVRDFQQIPGLKIENWAD